jgi:hypothetical protein
MKAIQVKFMGCTDTKSSRLKVWAEGIKAMIVPVDYSVDIYDQAQDLVKAYIAHASWTNCKVVGFGTLPNGDWVGVMG